MAYEAVRIRIVNVYFLIRTIQQCCRPFSATGSAKLLNIEMSDISTFIQVLIQKNLDLYMKSRVQYVIVNGRQQLLNK